MATTMAQPIVLGGTALVAVGLGYLALKGISSSSSSGGSGSSALVVSDIDDDEDGGGDGFITTVDVVKIFDRLYREMSAIFGQLIQQVQAIQMAGQNIPEQQLRAMIKGEMERALATKQKMILDEFNIDYDCLEEATWEFLEDEDDHPEVKAAVNRFQKFWQNVSNEEHEGWRPGKEGAAAAAAAMRTPIEILSPERLMAVAQVYFDSLTNKMKELVEEYKAAGKDLKNPAVQQQLNMEFTQHAETAGEEAMMRSDNVSMKQFEASIKAHSDNPIVGQRLQMLQMQQQRELMAIGSS